MNPPSTPATPTSQERHRLVVPCDDRSTLTSSLPLQTPSSNARNTRITPSAANLPRRVRIIEVGPRDGLQNETVELGTKVKQDLVNELVEAGLRNIEVTAFVSKRRIPQLSDAREVIEGIKQHGDAQYLVCIPNMRGLKDAISAGARNVAIMVSATDEFSKRNINCTIEESIVRYENVIKVAKLEGIKVRAYISCALGCPYTGKVGSEQVAKIAKQMYDMGCYEIALGDTIGVGNPRSVVEVVTSVIEIGIPVDCIGVHFHDTKGIALANVLAAMSVGVSIIDSSIAGLGGCPFAPGSAGNLATEDLVDMLQGMNIDIGDVNLEKLISIGNSICTRLGCETRSRVAQSYHALKTNLVESKHL